MRAEMHKESKLGELQVTMLTSNEDEATTKWELEKSNLLNVVKPHLRKTKHDGAWVRFG